MCALYPNKIAYPNKSAALGVAFRRLFSPTNPPQDTNVLYAYNCPSCGQVHLTKVFQPGRHMEAVRLF
jgi:hypothetical protein